MVGGQAEAFGQVQRLLDAGGLGGLTDSALLARFVERREEAAFEALVARHGPTVLRVCRGVLGTGGDADDAFQATFLVLARKAQALEGNDSVGLWLFEVARRVATRARSDAARRARIERNAARETVWLPDPGHDRADLEAVLVDEVRRLPEVYRAAIVLCYWQGLSYELAASRLGVPESTVRGRLARGRRRLRDRLARRGIALPAAGWLAAGVGKSTRAAVSTRLVDAAVQAATGAPGGRAALLTEAILRSLFMTRLTIATAALVLVGGGFVSLRIALADPPTEAEPAVARSQAAPPPRAPEPAFATTDEKRPIDEPKLELAPNPAPWKTVVRVKVQGGHAVGFGSGTVIQSTAESSLILTCAHIFKVDDHRSAPRRVTVDLFDGLLREGERAQVHYAGSVGAEVVDLDPGLDVGLIRIRPGRKLPASPVVPRDWKPAVGMKMTTAGCSEGNDATFWTTEITKPKMRGLSSSPRYEAIECRHAPKQGRTGGGLFTTDGYLAGVCNYAEPRGDHGLYAAPASIYQLLDRNLFRLVFHGGKPKAGDSPRLGFMPPIVLPTRGQLASSTHNGMVLFVDDDQQAHVVMVEYRPGDPHGIRVRVPSSWNLGNAWQAYEVMPGGISCLRRARLDGRMEVEISAPFKGVATVILARDPESIESLVRFDAGNRQEATQPEGGRTPKGR